MSPSLSTQFHRALFALPLLAIGLAAGLAGDPRPASPPIVAVEFRTPVQGAASTLPADDAVLVAAVSPKFDCAATAMPAGPRGLARMPGDISTLAVRLRCAQ